MKKKAFLVVALVLLVGIAIHANASDPVSIYFEEMVNAQGEKYGVKCFIRNESDKPRVVTMLRLTKKVNLNGGLAFPPIPLDSGETFCAGTFIHIRPGDVAIDVELDSRPGKVF
jgi:hypothetical protein